MKFFKNRFVAILLCVLMVVGSTLLNTRIKLGGQCRETARGLYADGGIAPQLELLVEQADTLASLAESKGLDADALRSASQDLQSLLDRQTTAAGALHVCYETLVAQLNQTEIRLIAASLGEQDATALSASLDRIRTAQQAIAASPYNENVRAFCRLNDRFPTGILAKLSGVSFPQEFA